MNVTKSWCEVEGAQEKQETTPNARRFGDGQIRLHTRDVIYAVMPDQIFLENADLVGKWVCVTSKRKFSLQILQSFGRVHKLRVTGRFEHISFSEMSHSQKVLSTLFPPKSLVMVYFGNFGCRKHGNLRTVTPIFPVCALEHQVKKCHTKMMLCTWSKLCSSCPQGLTWNSPDSL